ncbi:hypothetical protein [Streptomyces sp. NPDC059916]|uniref:hypothetical protein n=1 Tax=Streptomyces sp. NPDC059916 TaxID=3347001 RepID=UPI0036BE85EA
MSVVVGEVDVVPSNGGETTEGGSAQGRPEETTTPGRIARIAERERLLRQSRDERLRAW